MAPKQGILIFKGSNFLRQRLVLSVLSGKAIRITNINSLNDEPGLQEFEISLIRLFDKITNGTIVEISETGTSLYFQPGLLHGGKIEHECSVQRGIGYYLEVLFMVGPFCKVPLHATLHGVTINENDPSVDHFKISMLPVIKKFILDDEDLNLKITKRGMLPHGGGEVIFSCPVKKSLRPIQLLNAGMVKRIRGTAYALRLSPAMANRMVESAKGVLLNFLPDVYINTDQCKGKQSGKSPGFGIHLYAETNSGTFYSAEQMSKPPSTSNDPSVPEDIGTAAAQRLLNEIYLGGCVDIAAQSIALLFMALGPKDVSKIMLGPLSSYTMSFLQHLKQFFGITFKIELLESSDQESEIIQGAKKIMLTCIGVGYTNLSKRTL